LTGGNAMKNFVQTLRIRAGNREFRRKGGAQTRHWPGNGQTEAAEFAPQPEIQIEEAEMEARMGFHDHFPMRDHA
jgi:hypothetical protein